MKRQLTRNRDEGELFGLGEWLRGWRKARRQAKRRRDREQVRRRTMRPQRERFSDWEAISRYADPFE